MKIPKLCCLQRREQLGRMLFHWRNSQSQPFKAASSSLSAASSLHHICPWYNCSFYTTDLCRIIVLLLLKDFKLQFSKGFEHLTMILLFPPQFYCFAPTWKRSWFVSFILLPSLKSWFHQFPAVSPNKFVVVVVIFFIKSAHTLSFPVVVRPILFPCTSTPSTHTVAFQRHIRSHSRAAQPKCKGRWRSCADGRRQTLHLLLGIEKWYVQAANVPGFNRIAASNENAYGNLFVAIWPEGHMEPVGACWC